jgi:hypothetical protein
MPPSLNPKDCLRQNVWVIFTKPVTIMNYVYRPGDAVKAWVNLKGRIYTIYRRKRIPTKSVRIFDYVKKTRKQTRR